MKDKTQCLKIFVACHKKDSNIRQNEIYMPIQVGKALHSDLNLGMQNDNTGDNISIKNGTYCELTALYWAWKNLVDEEYDKEYIGLAHYRRYLHIDKSILGKLDQNTVILPTPIYTFCSNLNHLTDGTTREDVYILLHYLNEKQPKYIKSAINYLYNSNGWIGCNMFIGHKTFFNDYCKWLFKVLNDLEGMIQLSPYTRLKRIYGYIGEVLLPIYCMANNIKIIFADYDYKREKPFINYLKHIYIRCIFRLSHPYKIKTLIVPASTEISLKTDGIL